MCWRTTSSDVRYVKKGREERERKKEREKEGCRTPTRRSWQRVRKGLQRLWRHDFDRPREQQISRTMKTFLLYNRSSRNGVIHTAFTLHFLHNIAKVALLYCALFLPYLELLPIVVILRKLIITTSLNFLSRYPYRARSSHNSHVNCVLCNSHDF